MCPRFGKDRIPSKYRNQISNKFDDESLHQMCMYMDVVELQSINVVFFITSTLIVLPCSSYHITNR